MTAQCPVSFTAPLPGQTKVHHVFRCDRPAGHPGAHEQAWPTLSLTQQSRRPAPPRPDCDHVWMHDLEPSLAHECERCGVVADCECWVP